MDEEPELSSVADSGYEGSYVGRIRNGFSKRKERVIKGFHLEKGVTETKISRKEERDEKKTLRQ